MWLKQQNDVIKLNLYFDVLFALHTFIGHAVFYVLCNMCGSLPRIAVRLYHALRTQSASPSGPHGWILNRFYMAIFVGLAICADSKEGTPGSAKTCPHQYTLRLCSASRSFSVRHRCSNIPEYDLFIVHRLSQFPCSFSRNHYTIAHSCGASILWTLGLFYSRDWKINEQINYTDHETFKCSSAWLIVWGRI